MKKIIQPTLYILLMTMMTSCILSMEEFIVPEDQKGKDEPCTEVSPYGEVTYQYHDNVTSLNGEPQGYIAMMNDSVIWFMDNMPEKWIPKEGNYMAANCSQTIPLGLCAKVRSVFREGGMIRVEYEPAEKEEVFKSLEIRLDFEYIMPGVSDFEPDSIEIESRSTRPTISRPGYWKNDSVFVDMSLYEPNSRSDGAHSDVTEFKISKAFDIPYANQQICVDLNYKSTEVVNVHQYKDLSRDYQEEWNDTYTERDINILVGYGNNPEGAQKSLASFPKGVDDIRGYKKAIEQIKDVRKNTESVKAINPVVSIPSFPFGVMFRFDVSVGYSIMGYGQAEIKYRSETHRTGYIVENGNKREIDKIVKIPGKEPYDKITNVNFGGSIDFWLRGRIGVGVLVGNSGLGVGGVLGIEGKVGFKASLETEFLTDYLLVDRQNFNAGLYASFSGFGEGIVKVGPWTGSLGDFNFNTVEVSTMSNMKAEVNTKKTKSALETQEKEVPMEDENGNPYVNPWTGEIEYETRSELAINTSLNFSKLETFFIFPKIEKQNQRAALRVYEGTILNGSDKCIQVENMDEVLQADKSYNFTVNLKDAGLSEKVGVYEVVPCIYDKATKLVTEYRNNSIIVTPGTPNISQPKCYQWYARELSEDLWNYLLDEYGEGFFEGKKREDFTEYAFSTIVELRNVTGVKEWGIKYKLWHPDAGVVLERECPVTFSGLCRAGKYSIVTSFISEIRPKKPDSGIDAINVTAKPYCKYEDKKKYFTEGGYIDLYYPYMTKSGEPTTVGITTSQDFY